MTALSKLIESARAELPEAALARWASILFSLSILTLLISLAASQALLAAAAFAYAVHLLHNGPSRSGGVKTRPYVFPPVKLPLALFCFFSVVSVFWAANPPAGWLAVRKLVLFGIFLLTMNLIVSIRHMEFLYRALFVESALAGSVAVGQFVHQYGAVHAAHPGRVYAYMTGERIHGFMGHWMNFSGQQMLVFMALVALLLLPLGGGAGLKTAPSSRSSRRIWWLVLAVVGASIALSLTRGVWLGCFVGAIYVIARLNPRWLWALPVLVVACYFAAPTLVRQRVNVLVHPATDPSLSIRFEMWHVAKNMLERHPWVGVGPNNIEEVYLLYLPSGKAPVVGYHEHLHNNLLQLGAERGLPALAAWVWLMAALGWRFWRIRRQLSGAPVPTWIADAAIAAWLAFLVEGCFEFNFGTSPVLMLFLFMASTPFVVERLKDSIGSRMPPVRGHQISASDH